MENKINKLELLGSKYKGTIIEDPVMEPFFITVDDANCFTVREIKGKTMRGARCVDVCYPSTLTGCLERIIKEKVNAEEAHFTSLKDYIEQARKISSDILNINKEWGTIKL